MDLQGVGTIVSGGASGLGGATARELVARGARVAILDRDADKANALAAELGDAALACPGDVTNEEEVQTAVDGAVEAFGGIRFAAACAGIGWAQRTVTKDGPAILQPFETVIQVNLIGSFNVLRIAAAAMVKNEPDTDGGRGAVVMTASIAAFDGQIGQIAYSASKGGVVGMTLPAARDLASLGVRVCTIAPGLFDTPLLAALPQEAREALGKTVPHPARLGDPAEYAQLACHIAENPMLNGETIRLDGALRMAPGNRMRAAVLSEVGGLPVPGERDAPSRGEGQALVRVLAAPLNPVELSTGSGKFYAGPPSVPYVPGKEGVGEVLEGSSLPAGERVYFMTNAGYGADGAFAEVAAVDEEGTIKLPAGVDPAVASCLGIAGLAGWLSVAWRAELREGETVLVLGAGGAVGQIAIQAARLLGAGRIVAAARDPEGLARARALGAHEVVDLTALKDSDAMADAFRAAAGGDLNVTIDPVWGEPALAAMKASGLNARVVQLGQSAAAEALVPSSVVRGRLLAILGFSNFAAPREVMRAAYALMCEHAAGGDLVVELEEIPLEDVAGAWERQAASPGRKLVIVP